LSAANELLRDQNASVATQLADWSQNTSAFLASADESLAAMLRQTNSTLQKFVDGAFVNLTLLQSQGQEAIALIANATLINATELIKSADDLLNTTTQNATRSQA
jgi:hypothetical protein